MMGQEDVGPHIFGRGILFKFRCDYPLDDVTIQTIYTTKGYSSKKYSAFPIIVPFFSQKTTHFQ